MSQGADDQKTAEGRWRVLDVDGRLATSVYGFPGGTSRCTALRYGDDQWVVFSPGAGLEQTPPSGLTQASEVLLIAPAVAHTLGLLPWSEHFSSARLAAAAPTAARLKSKLSLDAESLDAVRDGLSAEVTLHTYSGSNFGEVWVRYETDQQVFLLVCDGFTNIKKVARNPLIRLAMWLYGLRLGLRVTPLYRYNIQDHAAYRGWVEAILPTDKPLVLIPCHGKIEEGPEVADQLRELMRERF